LQDPETPNVKKIFLVLALAYAFTTGMAAATIVAHMDQAIEVAGNCPNC
jgi:hypothetical protein